MRSSESGHQGHEPVGLRGCQGRYQMRKCSALNGRGINNLQAAVRRSGMRYPRVQLDGSILIVQGYPAANAGYNRMPEFESQAPGADVCTAACQPLVRYRELSRQIDGESWVAKLKSLHTLGPH